MTRDQRTIQSELLVLHHLRGDRRAAAQLVALWEERLFYYLRRLAGDEQEAWDLLQQTWAKVFSGLRRLDRRSSLPAWLYRIARNTAMDRLRQQLAERRAVQELEEWAAAEEDPGEEAFANAELVHYGLSQLALPHREALTLFFLDDLSIEEIAGVLELAPGTVKSRLHYAKRALREALQREGSRHD